MPLLLAPALLPIVVLFLGGFAFGVAQSLGYQPYLGSRPVSLAAYRALAGDPAVRAAVGLTFRIALVSTLVSAVLAVVSALLIRRTGRGRRLVTLLFQVNLPVPHLVGAVSMLLLLGQSGLLARLGHAVGLVRAPADFPALTADRFGVAIVAEYVWKEVPFIGVVVLAALTGAVAEIEDAARSLGAGPWQQFRHVTLPLITPAVLSTSVIVFAFTFGSYEVPVLLGRPFPATLPVVAYQSYVDVDLAARPQAMAIAVVITVLVGLLVLVYLRLSERWLGRGLGGRR